MILRFLFKEVYFTKFEKWGKMSSGKMTFGGKCRSQGYHGKKWGKMFFGEKCRREKCRGEKRLWGKLSCTPA